VRASILVLAVTFVGASACQREQKPERVAEGYLFEKGPYQGFYDGAGKLTRLLYDQNGDKKADVVMLFYPNGRLRQVEADTDFDGKIDRWQTYSERGRERKVTRARGTESRTPGSISTARATSRGGRSTRTGTGRSTVSRISRTDASPRSVSTPTATARSNAGRSGWTDAWSARSSTPTATASAIAACGTERTGTSRGWTSSPRERRGHDCTPPAEGRNI
jgi:hypothetical protein